MIPGPSELLSYYYTYIYFPISSSWCSLYIKYIYLHMVVHWTVLHRISTPYDKQKYLLQ